MVWFHLDCGNPPRSALPRIAKRCIAQAAQRGLGTANGSAPLMPIGNRAPEARAHGFPDQRARGALCCVLLTHDTVAAEPGFWRRPSAGPVPLAPRSGRTRPRSRDPPDPALLLQVSGRIRPANMHCMENRPQWASSPQSAECSAVVMTGRRLAPHLPERMIANPCLARAVIVDVPEHLS